MLKSIFNLLHLGHCNKVWPVLSPRQADGIFSAITIKKPRTTLRSSVVLLIVIFELKFPVLALIRLTQIEGHAAINRLILLVETNKLCGIKAFEISSNRENV